MAMRGVILVRQAKDRISRTSGRVYNQNRRNYNQICIFRLNCFLCGAEWLGKKIKPGMGPSDMAAIGGVRPEAKRSCGKLKYEKGAQRKVEAEFLDMESRDPKHGSRCGDDSQVPGSSNQVPMRTSPRTGQAVRREDAGTFPEVWVYSVCSIVDELGLVQPRVKSVEVSGRS